MQALRIRDYRILWSAGAIFDAVSVLQTVAAVWVVFSLTGWATWVSLMVSSAILPTLVVSVPAGVLADAMSRRLLLLLATTLVLVSSVGLLAVWLSGAATASVVVLLGMVRGVGVGLFNPAWSVIFPFVVPRRLLSGALAFLTASAGVATVVSAYVGGLVAELDPWWGLAVAVIGYSGVIVLLIVVRVDEGRFVRTPFFVSMRMGLRHVRHSAGTHPILVFGSIFGLLSAGIRAVLPMLVDVAFGGTADLYGMMLAALGLGLVVGGGTRDLADRLAHGGIVAWAFGGCKVAGAVVAGTSNPMVAMVGLLVSGVAWTWVLSTLGIRYLMMAPAWVRARTQGVYHLAVFGAFGLGGVAAGVGSDRFGEQASILVLSGIAVVIARSARAMPGPVRHEAEDLQIVPGGSDVQEAAVGRPILVVERWSVGADRMEHFLPVLSELRTVRLRTGASEWHSFLDPDDPGVVFEHFRLYSGSEAARRESRYDREDRAILCRADAFRSGPAVRTEFLEVLPASARSYMAIPPPSSRAVIPR